MTRVKLEEAAAALERIAAALRAGTPETIAALDVEAATALLDELRKT